jgi:trk system potassium uptake protein TrkH
MGKRLVLFLGGKVLLVFAGCMVIPLLLTIYTAKNRLAEFGIPILIALVWGLWLSRGKNPYRGRLTMREGTALIAIGFFVICLLGTLPFYLAGYPFVDSLFESVSGFTTTGASALGDLSQVPIELLLWRSLSQWLGGLAVVLIFLTLIPQVGQNAMRLFSGELHGESAERLMPRMVENIHTVLIFYLLATIGIALCLFLAGMTGFEAVNYAMTIISTGGFTLTNSGIAGFHNHLINTLVFIFMFMAGSNYILCYKAYKEGPKVLWQDSEYKSYVLIVLVNVALVAGNLWWNGVYPGWKNVIHAFFQVIAFTSTTGLAVDDYNTWPELSKYCLFLLMFVGGCSGSTAGGIKVSRIAILLKDTWEELKRTIHPKMVSTIKMSGVSVPTAMVDNISRFFFAYIVLFFVSACLFALFGEYSFFASIGAAASCLASVGTAFEQFTTVGAYQSMNVGTKLVAIVTMLLGRLEIYSICILFFSGFWDKELGRVSTK